jgi:hypothetical protein
VKTAILALLVVACGAQTRPAGKEQGKIMSTPNAMALPFGLDAAQLAVAEITYSYQSGKTGAGVQRVLLRGDGTVRLTKTRSYQSPEETLEGKQPRMNFIRLLELAEQVNFFDLENTYRPEGATPYWIREIRIQLPGGKTHTVGVINDRLQVEFEHLAGAIKAITSLAVPEVLKGRFFPNL